MHPDIGGSHPDEEERGRREKREAQKPQAPRAEKLSATAGEGEQVGHLPQTSDPTPLLVDSCRRPHPESCANPRPTTWQRVHTESGESTAVSQQTTDDSDLTLTTATHDSGDRSKPVDVADVSDRTAGHQMTTAGTGRPLTKKRRQREAPSGQMGSSKKAKPRPSARQNAAPLFSGSSSPDPAPKEPSRDNEEPGRTWQLPSAPCQRTRPSSLSRCEHV